MAQPLPQPNFPALHEHIVAISEQVSLLPNIPAIARVNPLVEHLDGLLALQAEHHANILAQQAAHHQADLKQQAQIHQELLQRLNAVEESMAELRRE
jgi:hypothetical protein